jgi:hypothetical protein
VSERERERERELTEKEAEGKREGRLKKCLLCGGTETLTKAEQLTCMHSKLPGGGAPADCPAADGFLFVIDFGDGTCLAGTGGSINTTSGDCTQNLFSGTNCQVLGADFFIIAANPKNLSGSAYKIPDFQKYFTALGVGGIISASASLLLGV